MRKTRAALYCRVSTREQADFGYSIDEQERLLIKYCEERGYEIQNCYTDRGISGKNITGRPELTQLLEDAKCDLFDIVIVWKINRISRSLRDLLSIVELLDKHSVMFQSMTENFDNSTPAGKMQFQMMGIIGEFERESIAQNVRMGMVARARTGSWNGGRVLGYDSVRRESGNVKHNETNLVINPQEAEIVKEIFELYASGKGYKAIVNEINKKGYRTKKGNPFQISGVRDILMNPVYVGKIRFNVHTEWSSKRRRSKNKDYVLSDGLHEPIIDVALWDKVQAIMKLKSKVPKKYDSFFPLTGILRCPMCGAGMVISRAPSKGKRLEYYSCGAWKNKGTSVCHANSIRVDKANEEVLKRLSKLLSNKKMVKRVVESMNQDRKKQEEPSKRALAHIDRELTSLATKKQKIFDMYEEDTITKDEFLERKEYLNRQVVVLEQRKQELQVKITDANKSEIPYEAVQAILSEFGKLLDKCEDNAEKKLLLQMILKEITIDQARNIDSIKIQLNTDLEKYLISCNEDVSNEDASSIFMQKIRGYGEVDIVMYI